MKSSRGFRLLTSQSSYAHLVENAPSNWKCRTVYPKLAHVGGQLVDALKLLGDKEPVDMSLACMCETIDALGLTSFDKPYHNIECFKEGQPAHMLNVRSPVCGRLAAAWLVVTNSIQCIKICLVTCATHMCIVLKSLQSSKPEYIIKSYIIIN